jgi:putative transposase
LLFTMTPPTSSQAANMLRLRDVDTTTASSSSWVAVNRLATVMGDRGFRGLAGPPCRGHDLQVVITERPGRQRRECEPIQPLGKVEAAFAALGRWRRLARSFEGTTASATAWTQIAAVGVLLSHL